jgi:[protein-PII] uridylyltransferase
MASVKSLHQSFTNAHLPKRGASRKKDAPETISSGLTLYRDEIYFDSSTAILSNPFLLMEIFEKCSVLGCRLSLESVRLIRDFLHLVDDAFRASEKAAQLFLTILNNKYTFEALDLMLETGFLEVFIPEFGEIKDRVQFDAYHMFPVGRHSLQTVRQIKELANQKEIILHDILLELADPQPLFLAALLHDIGKKDKGHSRRGKAIAATILKRLGYDKEKTEDILFLIRHHLLLAETATRRDLNDEKIVVTCARTIRDPERLKMLYLLTYADSKATGPKAWNEWISNLVQELFFKIMHILERNELATANASKRVETTLSQARALISGRIDGHNLDSYFDVMTPRYLLNSNPHDIVRHISIVEQLGKKLHQSESSAFVIDARQDNGDEYWELVFSAKDRPGLFSDLSGVLAINNINILSADIYTWRDGTALDVFRVSRPLDPIHPEETWQKVEKNLKETFKGKLSLAYRLGQKAEPSILSDRKKPSRPPKVIIDNESSDFFTLVEVFADDRVGLLYDITRTLFELRLDIRIAIIATKVDQIADVFYIRDLDGQKVEDEDQLKEIKEALNYKLS